MQVNQQLSQDGKEIIPAVLRARILRPCERFHVPAHVMHNFILLAGLYFSYYYWVGGLGKKTKKELTWSCHLELLCVFQLLSPSSQTCCQKGFGRRRRKACSRRAAEVSCASSMRRWTQLYLMHNNQQQKYNNKKYNNNNNNNNKNPPKKKRERGEER